MALELDMVVDADPADPPLGKAIGLRRQRVEVGPIELFEQRPAGDTEAPDRAFVIELPQQLADCRIEFSQTVEAMVTQAAEQPSLDDQHRDFDLRLIARWLDRKSTRLNSSHGSNSYAVFCLKKKNSARCPSWNRSRQTTTLSVPCVMAWLSTKPRWLCRFHRYHFFFNDTATTEIYTLSLHDALPI